MAAPAFAEVALPLPLPNPLSYEIPAHLAGQVVVGARVRVRVGKRRLSGIVVGFLDRAPEGFAVKPIEELIDRQPIVTADLLALARFTAEYYRCSLGEVLRSLLPSELPPWGNRRLRLTNAGAFSSPRDAAEAAVIEALRGGGWRSVAELAAETGLAQLELCLAGLEERGWLASDEEDRRGVRYVSAVELAPGDPEQHRAAAGRSEEGRALVDYLANVGRPATVAEGLAAVGCGPGVVRRLVELGVLRRFTQVEKLSLDRHRLETPERAPEIRLRPDQQTAFEALREGLALRSFQPFLLQGMTGAGKTEVYLRAVEECLGQDRAAILLVPEIALVPALAGAVERRFGSELAILHSGLGSGERHQEWERVRRGEARVVLGPRSALFAPFPEGLPLGLMVVDEEQDPAYKQDSVPRYNGRDLALVRARDAGAVALLVSATPSLESRYNADKGKLTALTLTARAGQGSLPEGILVDLRDEEGTRRIPGEIHFSVRLREEIAATLAAGEQVILLRNRRGYSPVLLCRACGEDFRCEDCGLPRTYHRRTKQLLCHYCGAGRAVPESCPTCAEAALEPIGAGTERVEETFRELFPGVAVDVLDRDTARRPGGPAAILERFGRREVQVLIGTQMVSKGHHFPGVALAAVLAADTYLGYPDFRAVERTYNLLVQLAGRAGRGDRPGRVVIQTWHPGHYAIQAALTGDDDAFVREEMRFRRAFHYPPFSRMVQLLVKDTNREKAQERIAELARGFAAHRLARGVRITGPAPAPLERLRGQWRFQLLLRSSAGRELHRLLDEVLPVNPGWDLTVDVDPQTLL